MPLCLPDKDRRILISADASDIAVGGVVWLECTPHAPEGTPLNERKVEPLAFYSKLLTDSQQNWATIQKELYAILLILTESQLSSYLISRELTIFTDHKNLAYLISAPEKNSMVKRWIPILSEYLFTIVHTSGEDNHWADMMSRNVIKDVPTGSINNIVTNCPEHLFSITDSLCPTDEDTEYQTLSTESINMIDDALINKSKLFDAWLSKVRSTQVEAIKNNDPLFQHPSTCNKAAKKLHGKQEGPYLVIDIPSKSSLELQNFVTGHRFRSSIHLCTKYLSDKPSSDEFHKAVASCDSEEMVIIEILDQRDSPTGPICSVVWFDGDTTEEPLSLVKNTKAYSSFIKLNPHAKPKSKPNTKPRSSRNRNSNSSNTPNSVILTTPPAKRTRSSKRGEEVMLVS
ncbi:hypothetical protein GEMRC1_010671 [Eukaryota sp. GEM-RC1]